MSERPELLTFFAHRRSVYDVLPDAKPMTWSVWDSEGWIGDIALDVQRAVWSSLDREGRGTGPHPDWRSAIVGMIEGL